MKSSVIRQVHCDKLTNVWFNTAGRTSGSLQKFAKLIYQRKFSNNLVWTLTQFIILGKNNAPYEKNVVIQAHFNSSLAITVLLSSNLHYDAANISELIQSHKFIKRINFNINSYTDLIGQQRRTDICIYCYCGCKALGHVCMIN